jgi:hypothetical protein
MAVIFLMLNKQKDVFGQSEYRTNTVPTQSARRAAYEAALLTVGAKKIADSLRAGV